jgi:hypothetical protein
MGWAVGEDGFEPPTSGIDDPLGAVTETGFEPAFPETNSGAIAD